MEQHQDKIKLFENIVKTHQKKVETNEQKLRFNRTLAMFEKPPTKVSPSKGKYICAICNFGENIFQRNIFSGLSVRISSIVIPALHRTYC